MKFRDYINLRLHYFYVDHYPKRLINRIWFNHYGYKIDWKNPRDLNEKIQWLICYGDTSKWPDLADKYKVRDYIKEKGYDSILTKLYGVWDDAKDIEFEKLPDKFVLKCNHDSGSYHLIDKAKGFDKEYIIGDLNTHLKVKYGYRGCEPHYNKIRPRIIAEEFLEDAGSFSTSLVDYKVWCFNGHPYCIWCAYNRTHEHLYTNVYDLNWQVHPEWSVFNDHYRDGGGKIPCPEIFGDMLKVASDLSVGFPEVRVDFYIIDNKLYFGELTFTSDCGRMGYFTPEFLVELGRKVVIK